MENIPVLYAYDRHALVEALGHVRPRRCAVADLSLGGWGAQSLATQWLSQIVGRDVVPKTDAPPIEQLRSLGEGMCAGIDEEGRGNRALVQAFGAAQQLARLLARAPTALVVLVPVHGCDWRRDDRLLVEYLRALSPDTSLTAIMTAPPGSVGFLPPFTLAHALPTALSPLLRAVVDAEATAGLLMLDNGWAVVAPEDRRAGGARFDAAAVARFAHPRLALYRAFAMLYAEEQAVDPWHLCFEAWQQCHSGYRELVPALIDAAISHAPDATSRVALRAHRQAMRIADGAFADAADEPAAAAGVAPDIAALIEECRGWGMVMTNRPQEALSALRTALSLRAADEADKAKLLLMNIAALAELRGGHADRALTLERAIEARLPELPWANGELIFVNSINLARLRRYAGDFDDAERYYCRAFATFEGGRTETDQANVDLCFARLATARGDAAGAYEHWLRAALQWVASQCPEALNWRVQALVIGNARRIAVASHADAAALVENLAAGFTQALEEAAAAAGQVLGDADGPARHFLPSDKAQVGSTPLRLLGGPGWSVVAATTSERPRHHGEAMQRLRRRLGGWIAAQHPAGDENVYLVDRRDGSGMPGDLSEQLASAADHGVAAIHLADRTQRLDATEIARLRGARLLRLNPMVARIEGERAHFRRYLRPHTLAGSEAEIVSAAKAGQSVGATLTMLGRRGIPALVAHQSLLKLRELRVVQLRAVGPEALGSLGPKQAIAGTFL